MTTHGAFLARRRFPSLDGLRCLAILPVVFHHSTPRPLPGFLGRGPLGVHLFFALSGFLITTLLLRERRDTGALSLPRFYARRSLRIFPLYYLVLALYVVRAVLFLEPSPMRAHFLHNLPFFATYTANFLVDFEVPHPVVFGFSWSLATEEQFYLLWPPLLWAMRGRSGPSLVALGLLALDFAVEHGALRAWLGEGAALRAVTSISAPICLGSLAALCLDTPLGFRLASRLLGHRSSSAVSLAALLAFLAWDAPLLAIHGAMVALVVAVSVREDHRLGWLLESRPLVNVGTVSYGVYLLHVAVITAVKAVLPPALHTPSLVFALSVPAAVLVATLSFRYVERPFLSLADRFRGSTSPPG